MALLEINEVQIMVIKTSTRNEEMHVFICKYNESAK